MAKYINPALDGPNILFYNKIELHKYILTFELLGRIENLSYKCGNLPNRTITYGNNRIHRTFQKYTRMNKNALLIPILSNLKTLMEKWVFHKWY